ncbi:tryptophan synthase beta subunit-like PLP-dependent enzyme [Backusella circina FSU 941]|nr:tryptophan synthase beta subunit-like PLP-dependent enzyme [Backusella circina FSU 941]
MEESSDEEQHFHMEQQTLHVPTPLIHSTKLSKKLHCNIYLKMENLQPSGSVKMRGVGNFCYKAVAQRGTNIHLVCGSGINTILAVVYSARQLGVSAIAVVPKTTPKSICDAIRLEGAQLVLYGDNWNSAESHARKLVKRNGIYVPSSDHPDIWQGHKTIIHELKSQLPDNPPTVVICPVGGGGLLNGVIEGLQEVGWKDVPVIAVETHGSNAFQASVVAGKIVSLQKISTIASSLAAKSVSSKALELSLAHPVVPFAVSDAMAADAVRLFADDNKMLVEAASGAGLSLCYTQIILDILPSLTQTSNVVVFVTGGSDISLDQLDEYRKKYYRPPVVVKSGGEVFLKMADKLTQLPQVDMDEAFGLSPDMLGELGDYNAKTPKSSSAKQKNDSDDVVMSEKEDEDIPPPAKTPTPSATQ